VKLSESRKVFLVLSLYFLLQLAARLLVSPGLELDEAEQLVLTQTMQWGYGSQPPLYTWLLGGIFRLSGVTIFSLALLKNLLLFATYFFTYRSARELGYGRDVALAAMLSLFFIPQIVWESQRDLTHSVLATTLAAATIYFWIYLKNRPSSVGYAVMGMVWGMGLLAKYNYAIFLAGLLIASATIKEYRQLMAKKQIFLSLLVMSLFVAPHALWMIDNTKTVLKQSHKFKQPAIESMVQTILHGFTDLVMASVNFAMPLAVIYLSICLWHRRHRQHAPGAKDEVLPSALLMRSMVVSLLLCMSMVLLFRVTVFKDRWMQPLLFFLPLALLPWMHGFLRRGGERFIRIVSVVVGCCVLFLIAARPYNYSLLGKASRFNMPYAELAAGLEGQVSAADLVVAENRLLGGNLRLRYPWKKVVVPELQVSHDVSVGKVLVVWEGSDGKAGSRPDTGLLVSGLLGPHLSQVDGGEVTAPLRFLPGRMMTLSYATYVSTAL
jgi:4-amino-4-deoxy-L-arabinose transferase-like glycosyltransferase